MKKYIFVYVFLYICSTAFSQNVNKIDPIIRLYFSTGASYNFDISLRSFSQTAPVFFDIPFRIAVDVRFINWFSLYAGLETVYAFHLNEYEHENLRLQNHNMYIRLPFLVRFYPMVFNNENYQNVYLAVGGFAHFWPVQFYNVYDSDEEETTVENGYFPMHSDLPPAHVYSPANAGLSFAVGNSFPFGKNMLFGLELFMNYMFLPYKNGYYANPAFQIDNWVMLNFYANIGIMISIGIEFQGTGE